MTDKEIDLIRRLKTRDESALEEIIKVFIEQSTIIDEIDIKESVPHSISYFAVTPDKVKETPGTPLKLSSQTEL